MSRLPFELMLALRYLRPKRTFVSIITLICVIGVMLGVAVLIIVISVMSGFDKQLRDKLLGFNAHIHIEKYKNLRTKESIADYEPLMENIASNREVKAVVPYVMGQILAKTQPENGESLQFFPFVRGIDPELEKKGSILSPSSIVDGKYDVSGNGLLIGTEFAAEMNLKVGDRIAVYSIREFEKMDALLNKKKQTGEIDEGILPSDFEVRGIFELGYFDFDASWAICSLANAQDLFMLGDSVHGLMITLHDPTKAQEVRVKLKKILPPEYVVKTWEDDNSKILDALLVEKNVMFYLLFFIMIVAAFGITSALITFVVQKTREIGVLKALGASSRQVMWIFLGQSLMVGVTGVIAGFGLGLLAVHYRNEFLFFLRRVTGFELFPAQIYQFSELPAVIDSKDIMVICGGSLIICLLAGLFPAWNAGRLKPVEALRHE